jgi:hypothetical protein
VGYLVSVLDEVVYLLFFLSSYPNHVLNVKLASCGRLVERSYKIFFRVGTAILFLSQPTLLNQELDGMMTFLNTFPDATILKPDILIPCALRIKVTNRLLMTLEQEVVDRV